MSLPLAGWENPRKQKYGVINEPVKFTPILAVLEAYIIRSSYSAPTSMYFRKVKVSSFFDSRTASVENMAVKVFKSSAVDRVKLHPYLDEQF